MFVQVCMEFPCLQHKTCTSIINIEIFVHLTFDILHIMIHIRISIHKQLVVSYYFYFDLNHLKTKTNGEAPPVELL